MIKKTIIAAAITVLMAAPAFAFHCPADMAKIDAALPSTNLSGADLATVKSLRAQGEAEHSAGNHSASVATLAQAMEMLGINK